MKLRDSGEFAQDQKLATGAGLVFWNSQGGSAMLVRVTSKSGNPLEGHLAALAGERASSNEFKYRKGTEIFGEGEEAQYVYQLISGAVRTYKLLSDGRRQIGAFHLPGGYVRV